MGELSIIYYTANHLPIHFAKKTREILAGAVEGHLVVSVSHKPMRFGHKNICVGRIGRNSYNIYRQILTGAKAADTEYVAMAEDDVLYTKSHFNDYRPASDEFAYNHNKWAIHTWHPLVFSRKKNRSVMHQLIAPRKLLIEALEERFGKYNDPSSYPEKYWSEPGKYEKGLGITPRKQTAFYSSEPCVVFCHPHAIGYGHLGSRKRMGKERETRVEPWGSAEEVMRLWTK